MKILSRVSLQDRNTLAVPALAEYFVECASVQDVLDALAWAKTRQLAWRVLAGGSNVVLVDFLPGLTLVPLMTGREVVEESADQLVVRIAAGENWHQTVQACVQAGWYGLENLALIPGSVGAAPIQNIGAYGVELQERLHSLTALDTHTLTVREFSVKECAFAYRDSFFKSGEPERYLITSLDLRLNKKAQVTLGYPALNDYLQRQTMEATPENIFSAVVAIRQSKLPDPAQLPNAGSFFKNPSVKAEMFEALKKNHPDMPGFVQADDSIKLAAAWLIEKCGWKGREHEGVAVHSQHALVLVNPQKKSAQSILALAEHIRNDVYQRFGIELEQEPRLLQ